MKRRTARGLGGIAAVGLLVGALGTAPAYAAHSETQGITYYAPGSPQSGPSPLTVTLYATDTKPNTSFWVMAAPEYGRANGVTGGLDCGQVSSEYFASGGPFMSDAAGSIPPSTVTLYHSPGKYRMCFYEVVGPERADDPSAVFTWPVTVTVTS
jgi:hypothetical protein